MKFHGYENSFPFDSGSFGTSTMPPVYKKGASPFRFDPFTNTVTRMEDGLIDLGGIGKGYAVQAAARWLKHIGEASAGMVDGGGDISLWLRFEYLFRAAVCKPKARFLPVASNPK